MPLPTFLITGLAEEEITGLAIEHLDVFFVVGEYVTFRLVDDEDVLVVTVVLQDVVELVTAAWHKPTSYVRKNARTALIINALCIILILFRWRSKTGPYILSG
jgi:hypothetical protein